MSQHTIPIATKQARLFVELEAQLRLVAQVLMLEIEEADAVFAGIKLDPPTLLFSLPDKAETMVPPESTSFPHLT